MKQLAQMPEARPPLIAGAAVQPIIPRTMEEVFRLANAVVAAGMAPKDFKTAEACTIAILQGLEVGLAPMAALQRIAVINGRPTIWGDAALGLVRASGLLEEFEETVDDGGAMCRVKRRGEPKPIVSRFTTEDAKRAGLWGKAGPWQQYPRRMLQMRARAFALRDGFADVLGGMHIAEELQDGREARDVTSLPLLPPAAPPPAPPSPRPQQTIHVPASSQGQGRGRRSEPAEAPEDLSHMQGRQDEDLHSFRGSSDSEDPAPLAAETPGPADSEQWSKVTQKLLADAKTEAQIETIDRTQIEPVKGGMFPGDTYEVERARDAALELVRQV
jgi:hypothetical protein